MTRTLPSRSAAFMTSAAVRFSGLAIALACVTGLLVATPPAAAVTTYGLFADSARPKVLNSKDRRSVELGVKFSSNRAGKVVALQFYRGPKQKKAYKGSLWSAKGKLLARVTFPKSSRVGWQTAVLKTPIAIRKNTTYVASYLASGGHFPVTRGTFSKRYTRNGLTVAKKGGVYRYSKKSAMPKSSTRGSNYFVDVVFAPNAVPAPPAPTATPTKPTLTPSPTSSTPSLTPSPTRSTPPNLNPLWLHRSVPDATVRTALAKRVFFGHQSIGAQVLKGVTEYARGAGLGSPSYPDPESVSLPGSGGFIAQSYVAENGKPLDKIAEFDRLLRSGVANQIDVAVLKFCYADIRTGGYDPRVVFDTYKRTLAALEHDYPDVTFLHATEPIVMAANSDGPNNIPRETFNRLMRAEYGNTGRLWDVAAIEASTLDGRLVTGTYQGTTFAALNPEFASPDQRHITGPGPKAVAGPLLELIAKG